MVAEMFRPSLVISTGLADAIPVVLALVRDAGRPACVRNELNMEVLAVDIVLTDPSDRVPELPARRSPLAFCLAEFLWFCGQRSDLVSLEPYAPSIRSFYGGQANVTGSDYGQQLFSTAVGPSQWENVVTLLRHDPGSKRAFLQIFDRSRTPTLLPYNGDVACTVGFQALVRNGALHWVTTMRANDAYRGFVTDTFAFTLFQELLAATLGYPTGEYLHRVTSLHTYPEDEQAIAAVLAASEQLPAARRPRMPGLDATRFWPRVNEFWQAHDDARVSGDWSKLGRPSLRGDRWWEWVLSALVAFHGRRRR